MTVLALAYAGLLEGAVITETVFSWPGIGLYLTGSLLNADMNAVLGATLVIGLVYLVLNLLADLAYRLARPARQMSGDLVLSRDWLLSETPASRAQAAWVRRYRGWLQFRANGLAMVGLVTVAGDDRGLARRPAARARRTPARRTSPAGWRRRRPRTGSAPTSWAATSSPASCTAAGSRWAWWWRWCCWWRRSGSRWAASPAISAALRTAC